MLYLSITNQSGEIVARFSDFLSLTSEKIVNGVGSIRFSVLASHPACQHIKAYRIVKLYRREARQQVGWYQENLGIILDVRYSITANHAPQIEVAAFHPNFLLSTRIVAYLRGVQNRSQFLQVKTGLIAKQLVIWNATTAAGLEPHRLRDGQHTLFPIQVQASADSGANIDFSCPLHNLLAALQRLAIIGNGDFELADIGNGRFEFRWYDGGLGVDRSNVVLFALSRGNMANPRYELKNSQEVTVAIAAGKGEAILRQVAVCHSADYSVERDIEAFTYGSASATYEGLYTIAENFLGQHSAAPQLTFDIVQTPATYYGKHYFLGDAVSVHNPFTDEIFTAKIHAVTLSLQPQKGGSAQIAISLASSVLERESLNPWLFPSITDVVYTDNFTNPTLDGLCFTDAIFDMHLDGAGFLDEFLAEPLDGGTLSPPPG